jgi:hypothetical protein
MNLSFCCLSSPHFLSSRVACAMNLFHIDHRTSHDSAIDLFHHAYLDSSNVIAFALVPFHIAHQASLDYSNAVACVSVNRHLDDNPFFDPFFLATIFLLDVYLD